MFAYVYEYILPENMSVTKSEQSLLVTVTRTLFLLELDSFYIILIQLLFLHMYKNCEIRVERECSVGAKLKLRTTLKLLQFFCMQQRSSS
jgi:hypothetical protein